MKPKPRPERLDAARSKTSVLGQLEMWAAGKQAALLIRRPFQHGEGEKKHTLERELAVFRRIPLVQRVSVSAVAACAHGESRNAERERNVGVGGTQAEVGAQAEMAVDGSQSGKQRGIVRQLRRLGGRRFWRPRRTSASAKLRRLTWLFRSSDRRRPRRRGGVRLQGEEAD